MMTDQPAPPEQKAERFRIRQDLIRPLPSQNKALNEMYSKEYVLFGGSAGPGKSYWLRWALVELLMYWHAKLGLSGVRVGLFCETYGSLKDRHISEIAKPLPHGFPHWLGEIKDSKTDGLGFYLPERYGGGVILLRNLDDPGKYQSVQFAAIAVDELTKNPKDKFDQLRARKRWPGIDHSPFLAASNPGSIGHAWVKKLWLDRDFSGDDSELNPDSFSFIPAKGSENPHLPASYWATLKTLPPKLRKAMEEGNWDVYEGQYFGEWNRDLHVCEPFEIPKHWKRHVAFDYGFAKPSCVLWFATSSDGQVRYVYRELYKTGLTYPALAKLICEMTPLDEQVRFAVGDPAIWGDRPKNDQEAGPSGGEQMLEILAKRNIRLFKANNDRIQGWQKLRQLLLPVMLPDKREAGRFRVFSTCTNFIRTVPTLIHDQLRPEDLDSDGEDHAADAWRYGETAEDEIKRQLSKAGAYLARADELAAVKNYGIGFGR